MLTSTVPGFPSDSFADHAVLHYQDTRLNRDVHMSTLSHTCCPSHLAPLSTGFGEA